MEFVIKTHASKWLNMYYARSIIVLIIIVDWLTLILLAKTHPEIMMNETNHRSRTKQHQTYERHRGASHSIGMLRCIFKKL